LAATTHPQERISQIIQAMKNSRTIAFDGPFTCTSILRTALFLTPLLFLFAADSQARAMNTGVHAGNLAFETGSTGGGGLSLTVANHGIAFGNVPVVHGLRFNFRDTNLNRVNGANITILSPREPSYGVVRGLALGLPMTGGASITGVSAALAGITAHENIHGVQLALLGIGAGGGISGVTAAGLGFGSGGDVRGLNVAGLGLGADGHLSGVTVAGLGFGADGNVKGINLAGLGFGADGNVNGINLAGLGFGAGDNVTGLNGALLGFGAGEHVRGLNFGGLGVGAGGSITGISVTGLGLAAGDEIRGIMFSGLGIASGESVTGIAIAGLGIASARLSGITVSPAAGAFELARGAFFAPAYFRIEDGTLQGMSISAFNHIRGTQQGLTIGLYNYARRLNGIQIGILNYAANNPRGLKLLPIANANL
jgi:hypothetical protein